MSEKKAKKSILPENKAEWTVDHDMVVIRRIGKLIDQLPDGSLSRVRYFVNDMFDAARTVAPLGLIGAAADHRKIAG